jgi:hypothetical protein
MNNMIKLKLGLSGALIAVELAMVSVALAPAVQAVSPAPDGCYPGFTTAEGCNALNFLTTGAGNTGLGWYSLYVNTTNSFNTGVGAGTLVLNNADSNTAVGAAALLLNTTGVNNTAVGTDALVYNDNGGGNTANGAFALFSNTTGIVNVAMGWDALPSNDNGSGNVAIGEESLVNNVSGGVNTVVGAMAGANIEAGSNNIYIGWGVDANGPFDESDTIRIGRPPNATSPALHCFIGGIAAGGATANLQVDPTTGELLQVVSSARYKENIQQMGTASDALFALKPVTFHYKKEIDPAGKSQFGLVAEEVEKVNPDLVVRDKEGKPYSVRYDQVNAMLLNEFLKEHRAFVEEQQKAAQQQKEIDLLKAELKEQRSLIQKVSDRIEVKNSTPQVVVNK